MSKLGNTAASMYVVEVAAVLGCPNRPKCTITPFSFTYFCKHDSGIASTNSDRVKSTSHFLGGHPIIKFFTGSGDVDIVIFVSLFSMFNFAFFNRSSIIGFFSFSF